MELKEKQLNFNAENYSDICKSLEKNATTSAVNYNSEIDVEFMDPDTVCGIWNFKPQWLQKYATSRNYLILYAIAGMVQGTYFSYLIGVISTLEKRYSFKSKTSGIIMMVDEVTPLIFGPVLGYFGGKLNKPKLMTSGLFVNAMGSFLSALPYFLYGQSQHEISMESQNETSKMYCDLSFTGDDICDESGLSTTMVAVVCLIIGSFVKGFGNICVIAIGMTYMDDNTKMKNMPMHFAIVQSIKLFGPIIGFGWSSAFLKYYENPLDNPGYDSEDPRWIGAWWIGFVLQGFLLIIFATPLLLFPRRLPSQKKRAFSNTQKFDKETYCERVLGMLKAFKRMLTNPFYLTFVSAAVLNSLGQLGLTMLVPKYTEIQFDLSSSKASLYSGAPTFIAMQIMILFGGWVMRKYKPSAKKVLIIQTCIQLIWGLGLLILMIPSCEHFEMRGTTLTENGLDIQNECNKQCSCTTNSYSPVCGPDGISTYFSPCHAGCMQIESYEGKVISNCSCLFDENGNIIDYPSNVTRGLCNANECGDQALIYLILYPIFSSITILLIVAEVMILLRCVQPQDKSLSLGLFEAFLSAFGLLPHPIIYGALADSACLVWESSCSQTGNCWFYDINKLNYLLHGWSAGFVLLACVCFFMLCFMSDRINNLYDDANTNDRINNLTG